MNVLIGTPCAGGQVSVQYLMSFVAMLGECIQHGIKPLLYTLSQESLLPRARNHLAQRAMAQKCDKLFFIDADTGWDPGSFIAICKSPFPICAGLVPLKVYPTVYNYVPYKEDDKYFKNNLRTPEGTLKMRTAHGMSEIPVAFTGTAFLCIDSQVLHKLSETEKPYQYPDPFTGEVTTHWDFFGGGPMFDTYYSEDWAFCEKARRAGYDIRVNFDVRCNHVGQHLFRGNNQMNIDQVPEAYRDILYRLQNCKEDDLINIENILKEKVPQGRPQTNIMSPKADVVKYQEGTP